ncbi:MAG: subclass B3 metallo-beta-lactamase [Acidobacteria bacterium]|nr:subclass B3 metallo-beta-lactamase [Acidobacteriota bacterium]
MRTQTPKPVQVCGKHESRDLRRGVLFVAAAMILMAGQSLVAQQLTIPPRANNTNYRKEPFRIIGDIYWVGHTEIGAYLIKTPAGSILMDTTSLEQSEWVRENLDKLGVKMKDIKILINSHEHAEHMAGLAKFKQLSGAKLIASKPTADQLAVGGRTDFRENGSEQYPPVKADQIIEDGGKVQLGGTVLTAHLTPGHSKGCTTWTTTVEEDGRKYNVVWVCVMTPSGPDRAPLINNAKYPNIVEDYQRSFAFLTSIPCDVCLYTRATNMKLAEKQARLEKGEKPNPFIDPAGCKPIIKEAEDLFNKLLAEQRTAAKIQE